MAVRPEVVQFEVNTACNLRCGICPATAFAGRRPIRSAPFEDFRDIFERSFLPPYMTIFSGFSEALLHRDLPRMVELEKRRGCRVLVATNGVLLDARRSARLLDAGVDQLVVSLDSARPEIYEAVRPGARLRAVLGNVRRLRREIARRSSPAKIVVNSVVLKSTAAHLPGLLELLRENGIEDLALIKVMKMAAMKNPYLRRQFLTWKQYDALRLDGILERAREMGIRAMRSDGSLLAERGCQLPTGGFYVSADFDLTVCPFLSFSPRHVFGNLRKDPIETILARKPFVAFRERFARRRWPSVCGDCACLFGSLERS